jgi:hypothetical protein
MLKDFNPRKPVAMFNAFVSDAVQLNLCKQINAQYALAADHCYEHFLDPEARDLLPHYRRAGIESALADCFERYKDFDVVAATNIIRNCAHRAIIVSNRIRITHSSVSEKGELPREALFRQTYASSGQMYLFEEYRPPEPDPSMYLYAIITHRPSDAIRVPEFIDIIFPDENYENIIGRIPLLDKFPQVRQVETEAIGDTLNLDKIEIKLKKKRNA